MNDFPIDRSGSTARPSSPPVVNHADLRQRGQAQEPLVDAAALQNVSSRQERVFAEATNLLQERFHEGFGVPGGSGSLRSSSPGPEPSAKRRKKNSFDIQAIKDLQEFKDLEKQLSGISAATITSIYGNRRGGHDTYLAIVLKLLDKVDDLNRLTGPDGLFSIRNISSMLHGAGAKTPEVLDEFVKVLEEASPSLDRLGVPSQTFSSMLSGARAKAPAALDELVTALKGAKLRLEELDVPLTSLSAMLHGAGAKAPAALDELVTVLQGAKLRLEEQGVPLTSLS
ncbi:hypothetical protein, partial [uncultured Roseibium sp.]|uniref:hypothetical protein n=1 Tax=uncultured Roseibium sp. TaxID=1936171 RepID=UPI002631B331